MADNVSRPKHYTAGGIECIDAIRAALGPEGFRAYCIGNVLKYNWRYRLKNGAEDLRKAQVYLGWAIGSAPLVAQTDMTKPGPPIDPPEVFSPPLDPKLRAMLDRGRDDPAADALNFDKAHDPASYAAATAGQRETGE